LRIRSLLSQVVAGRRIVGFGNMSSATVMFWAGTDDAAGTAGAARVRDVVWPEVTAETMRFHVV
jgi:hypothetical protein